MSRRALLLLLALAGCGGGQRPPARKAVTLTVLGTNDLHGAVARLPVLAGYVANVRAARAQDGGGVVLVDAGDLFQGTLESNLNEGAAVVEAYNAIGYDASAIGNHEFDFGPVGPTGATGDLRGALKARAAEARFPFLAVNVAEENGSLIAWPNTKPSTMVTAAGVKVGIIGASTPLTPVTTNAKNFAGLHILPPAETVAAEARKLRAAGAEVVVVAAHMGTFCKDLAHPDNPDACQKDGEIAQLAQALPPGLVDVIVAGHTHSPVAHRMNGIAVIESYSSGRALGRVDLHIGKDGKVQTVDLQPPRDLCPSAKSASDPCVPGDYEGRPVVADAAVAAIAERALAATKSLREEKLGVTLGAAFAKAYAEESAEGNLFCDLMLAARPDVDAATTNGGGLRKNLPAGELTYGQLYEAVPFDNRLTIVTLPAAKLRELVAHSLEGEAGLLSFAGLTAEAVCQKGDLVVTLRDRAGKVIEDGRSLRLAASDFLTGEGGPIFRLGLPAGSVEETEVIIRDAIADVLRRAKGKTLWPKEHFDPSKPRLVYPSKRPLVCDKTGI